MILVRLIRSLFFVAGLAAVVWLTGLILFVEHVRTMDATTSTAISEPADAIVVLTGGSERVRTGVDLLKAGHGKKLFISGVHLGLSLEQVLGNQVVPVDLRNCCIILGHTAESTQGNVEETQSWLALENYHSMRLVTANYHMPRSLLLFHNLLPDVKIIPYPVVPETVVLDDWWRHGGTESLLITEYDKYLFARIGLWVGAL